MKTISERHHQGRQSWEYDRVVEVDGHKLRVHIDRDSYDEQSSLKGYILDPVHLKWNQVIFRPIKGAACEGTSYVRPEPIDPFRADGNSVLDELIQLLPN